MASWRVGPILIITVLQHAWWKMVGKKTCTGGWRASIRLFSQLESVGWWEGTNELLTCGFRQNGFGEIN